MQELPCAWPSRQRVSIEQRAGTVAILVAQPAMPAVPAACVSASNCSSAVLCLPLSHLLGPSPLPCLLLSSPPFPSSPCSVLACSSLCCSHSPFPIFSSIITCSPPSSPSCSELARRVEQFVLRRTREVNAKYLPPLTNYVVFVRCAGRGWGWGCSNLSHVWSFGQQQADASFEDGAGQRS